MKSPFVFHKIVTGERFVGREQEVQKLCNNFRDGINTFIISPRRTGKTSLVLEASHRFQEANKSDYWFVFINIWNVRSEEEFYDKFTNEVLQKTASKFSEIVENAKAYLTNVKPTIDLEYESIKLSLGLNPPKRNVENVLDLPEKLATKRSKHLVVCLDEFQDIENFDDPVSFQKNLRSTWQRHQNVCYILYGSKKHMLSNLFENPSMPFYRFGDIIYLKRIENKKWIDYIVKSFRKTQKEISKTMVDIIVNVLQQHPYYIQQFFNILWQNTESKVSEEQINESFEEFIEYNGGQFELILKNLSVTQLNFLKALSNDVQSFHAQETLKNYKLGSSANVTSIKKALLEKEIIELKDDTYSFTDPAFLLFFKKIYNPGCNVYNFTG
jgi:hypothetical protein